MFCLNGAGREPDSDYPVLQVSDPTGDPRTDGVVISMTAHFSTAKWAAVPGRAFFFSGGPRRDQPLTHAGYVHVLAEAKRLGLYRDVTFHAEACEDKPRTCRGIITSTKYLLPLTVPSASAAPATAPGCQSVAPRWLR